jgi:hypothetical protein
MFAQFEGIIIGAAAFLIIGLFHPIIIKGEYYFSVRIWPAFLVVGLISLASALAFSDIMLLSACFGIFGFTSLWSILELFEQRKRVEKGWFPANPKRAYKQTQDMERE